jgi:hypothetical protein
MALANRPQLGVAPRVLAGHPKHATLTELCASVDFFVFKNPLRREHALEDFIGY